MHAVAELFVLDLGDHLRRHLDTELHRQTLDALLLALGGSRRQLVDHILRHGDAGDVLVHVARHARRLERNDARHDVGLDARGIDLFKEALKDVQVKNTLGLDVHRAVFDLLAQLVDLQLDGVVHGRDGRALVELRCAAGDLVAAAVAVRLLHLREHFQDADGVEVIDRLTFAAVAHDGMVAGEREHRVDAERGGGENIAHDRHTVAVTAGHLEAGLNARLLQLDAKTKAGGFEAGGLHIGHVHAVYLAVQKLRRFHLLGKIIALRGRHLGGDAELAGLKCFFQDAHFLSPFRLMVLG